MARLETMEKWERLLVRYAESDLDAKEFCKAEGITYVSLFSWKHKLLPNLRERINDFWRDHKAKQLESGLTFSEYCRENDLSRDSFKSFMNGENKRIKRGEVIVKKPLPRELPRPPRFSDEDLQKLIQKLLPRSTPKPETIKLWYQRLTDYYESGLSIDEYAKKADVSSGYLRQWISNLNNYFKDGKPQPIDFDNVRFGKVVSNSQKRQQWRKIMEEFAHAGQTVKEFCKQRGIETVNFHQWKKSLHKFDQKHGIEKKVTGSKELGVRRSSIVKWLEILRRFERSKLTMADFVRQNEGEFSDGSLISWKKKLAPYFVKNEHGRYHEIDLLKPKLPEKTSREKLKKLWEQRQRTVTSILSTDKAPLSYYFWAVELGLDLDGEPIPVLYDPASTMEQIEEAEKNGTLRGVDADSKAKGPQATTLNADPLEEGPEQEDAAVVEELEPPEDFEAPVDTPQVISGDSGVCVSITMPDGAQIDLPKNMFAIEALVQRLISQ